MITDIIGASSRPFTIPGSLMPVLGSVFPSLAFGWLTAPTLLSKYLVNLGAEGYADGFMSGVSKGKKPGQNLAHELTHVWQGRHDGFAWNYVINSVKNQLFCGLGAYDYPSGAGAEWNTYQAEQQAHIVEDWYSHGATEVATNDYYFYKTNPNLNFIDLFRYVKCNIRTGNPDADSTPSQPTQLDLLKANSTIISRFPLPGTPTPKPAPAPAPAPAAPAHYDIAHQTKINLFGK